MRPPAGRPHRALAITTIPIEDKRAQPSPAMRRGGRPSRTAALKLRDQILEVATDLFLTQGYGLTTIEAVARRAGISKRTFYHRFADKAALFAAVVHRIIDQMRPPADVPLLEGATLQDVLTRLAGLILRAAVSPPAIALHRLIIAESGRFPELARAVNAQGASREATTLISELLAREFDNADLAPQAREFAAQQFLQMVVAVPQRRAIGFDAPMNAAELDAWAESTARLFLDGCRGWRLPVETAPRTRAPGQTA